MIADLEQEIQHEVDAKMKLAVSSNVYEQLSDDVKGKSAILAALKATVEPPRNTMKVPTTVSFLLRTASAIVTVCAVNRTSHIHHPSAKKLRLRNERQLLICFAQCDDLRPMLEV